MDNESYETGYREGASSLVADIRDQFTEYADSMDGLLEFFRRITGDPNLDWPDPVVDWRDMFARYARSIQEQESYFLLHEFEWTPGEWAAIRALPGMERPV